MTNSLVLSLLSLSPNYLTPNNMSYQQRLHTCYEYEEMEQEQTVHGNMGTVSTQDGADSEITRQGSWTGC
jgi:hypothetical protein